MIFISKYKNYRITLRPTIKRLANTGSGAEEVLKFDPITIQFQAAMFDTKNWRQYSNDMYPDAVNVVKKEDDLIRLMKANPYYGSDFFDRGVAESREERRARLQAEMDRLDAEDAFDDPESALEIDETEPSHRRGAGSAPMVPEPEVPATPQPTTKAPAPRSPAKKATAKKAAPKGGKSSSKIKL